MTFDTKYVLPNNVSAIQALPAEDGQWTKLGLITQLPEGAELQIGGPGFSEETVRVRCGGALYFLFLEDLDLRRMSAAGTGAG